MILSHRHKFIFLKTRKTAGTSIEISLSRFCGPKDILTPISLADEKIRFSVGKQAQNYSLKGIELYNHIPASEVKVLVGNKVWNSYYKFCFDRNPWDKVVSSYYYLNEDPTVPFSFSSFEQFFSEGWYKRQFNYPLYTIDDTIAVDYIGRFENLNEDLQKICKNIGVPFDNWLPRAKGNFRPQTRHYRSLYTPQQRALVSHYYKKEIELHGYTF
ncbi:sulfotransferase family protein [Mechercharimyces sp. CAU 1602]|uniref:sulfotransferase family protein n=1 Tax=Mechercharimyces sp. CAU 1602 TaxID=2973933 RepID=UPI002162D664|nr:sulfotransferase family protein [Mechercharimyces sp. CAU 1602]MCS1352665.1 sulfotransferase family protein [Mechercharimyces sp. CAU 1602]